MTKLFGFAQSHDDAVEVCAHRLFGGNRVPREYRLEGPLKLRVSRALPAEEARFEFAADLMKRLAAKASGK